MAASTGIPQTTSLATAALDFLLLHSQGQLFFHEPSSCDYQIQVDGASEHTGTSGGMSVIAMSNVNLALTPPSLRPSSQASSGTDVMTGAVSAAAGAQPTASGSTASLGCLLAPSLAAATATKLSPSSASPPATSIFSSLLPPGAIQQAAYATGSPSLGFPEAVHHWQRPPPAGPTASSTDEAHPTADPPTAASAATVMQALAAAAAEAAAAAASQVSSLPVDASHARFLREVDSNLKAPQDDGSVRGGQAIRNRRQEDSSRSQDLLLINAADGNDGGANSLRLLTGGSLQKRSAAVLAGGAAAGLAAGAGAESAAMEDHNHHRHAPREPEPSDGYPCRVCGTWFPTGQALGGHMRKHVKDDQTRRMNTNTSLSSQTATATASTPLAGNRPDGAFKGGSSPHSRAAGGTQGISATATASPMSIGATFSELLGAGGGPPPLTGRLALQAAYHTSLASSASKRHADALQAATAAGCNRGSRNWKACTSLSLLELDPSSGQAADTSGGGGGNRSGLGSQATRTPSAGSLGNRGMPASMQSPRQEAPAGGDGILRGALLASSPVPGAVPGGRRALAVLVPGVPHLLLPAGGDSHGGEGPQPSRGPAAKRTRICPPSGGGSVAAINCVEPQAGVLARGKHSAAAAIHAAAVAAATAAGDAAAAKLLPSTLSGIGMLTPRMQNLPGSSNDRTSWGLKHAPPPAIPAWLQQLLAPSPGTVNPSLPQPAGFAPSSALLPPAPHTLSTGPTSLPEVSLDAPLPLTPGVFLHGQGALQGLHSSPRARAAAVAPQAAAAAAAAAGRAAGGPSFGSGLALGGHYSDGWPGGEEDPSLSTNLPLAAGVAAVLEAASVAAGVPDDVARHSWRIHDTQQQQQWRQQQALSSAEQEHQLPAAPEFLLGVQRQEAASRAPDRDGCSTVLDFFPNRPSSTSSFPPAGNPSTPEGALAEPGPRSSSSSKSIAQPGQLLAEQHNILRGGGTEEKNGSERGVGGTQAWLLDNMESRILTVAHPLVRAGGISGASQDCLRLSTDLSLLDRPQGKDDPWERERVGSSKGLGLVDLELRL